jgi:hypothetical protein
MWTVSKAKSRWRGACASGRPWKCCQPWRSGAVNPSRTVMTLVDADAEGVIDAE